MDASLHHSAIGSSGAWSRLDGGLPVLVVGVWDLFLCMEIG